MNTPEAVEKEKKDLLSTRIRHIDISKHDTRALIEDMSHMSFAARDLARAAGIYEMMLEDEDAAVILSLAGSTSAAGCMQIYIDMVRHNMVDAIVATGASIIDMDFFEALGYHHYRGDAREDDSKLRRLYIDRIYDTYIDEEELQACDLTITEIANQLEPGPYTSREFIWEMGRWMRSNPERIRKTPSLIEVAYEHDVPIFVPAFSDCSAGFGLVKHQADNPGRHLTIDSVKDFHDLTKIKLDSESTGVVYVGGGVPKNFTNDTVICAEILGTEVPMHKYTIQITVADERDGALSGSTLREAHSWGKVGLSYEQMVFSEATATLPLLVGYAYHGGAWKKRHRRRYTKLLQDVEHARHG